MRAKDIPVGCRFTLCHKATVYTRVRPTFLLESLAAWERGLGAPSHDHVFAIDPEYNLIAIHPDNGAIAL